MTGVAIDATRRRRGSTPRCSADTRRRAGSSRPTSATSVARPPSAAMLLAAFPAPPGTISDELYSRISTGASRETRATRPYTNSSATTSPITTTCLPRRAPVSESSCAESNLEPPSLDSQATETQSHREPKCSVSLRLSGPLGLISTTQATETQRHRENQNTLCLRDSVARWAEVTSHFVLCTLHFVLCLVLCLVQPAEDNSDTTDAYTRSGVMPFMHRWSMGHSRSMQGRHETG